MRILFVAMANSIHTVRWLRQLEGFDVHLFPSIDVGVVHPEMPKWANYHGLDGRRIPKPFTRKAEQASIYMLSAGRILGGNPWERVRVMQLAGVICRLRPDIVHSLEFQHGAYRTLAAREHMRTFPKWIVQNWGSDIYLFANQDGHKERIQEVLSLADYYGAETLRDRELGRHYGFKGEMLPLVPNSGGYDLGWCAQHNKTRASERKVILLKGLHGWAGRALVGLKAIESCADLIKKKGYRVLVYQAMFNLKVVRDEVKRIVRETGLDIRIMRYLSHQECLYLYGQSRVYMGLSISDAIPTSLLESMVMGAFPIQSNTGAAHDWIESGRSGFIVPPEDEFEVAQALESALSYDALVDSAQAVNWQTATQRLDADMIAEKVRRAYREIAS